MSDLVFSEIPVQRVLEKQRVAVENYIKDLSLESLSDLERVVKDVMSKFQIEVPRLDLDSLSKEMVEISVRAGREVAFMRLVNEGDMITVKAVRISVPFLGEAALFRVQPSSYSLYRPSLAVERGRVSFTIPVSGHDEAYVKKQFESELNAVQRSLETLRDDIGKFNDELKVFTETLIGQRLEAKRRDDEFLANIEI